MSGGRKREKDEERVRDSEEEGEREGGGGGIRPDIPSLIIVCCDKPL